MCQGQAVPQALDTAEDGRTASVTLRVSGSPCLGVGRDKTTQSPLRTDLLRSCALPSFSLPAAVPQGAVVTGAGCSRTATAFPLPAA